MFVFTNITQNLLYTTFLKYVKKNKSIADGQCLRADRTRPRGFLAIPVPSAVERLERIRDSLLAPETAIPTFQGKVARLMDFGAFVTILPGKDGLVHISQISNERVERVSDKLKEGDTVRVKVLEVDRQGRVRLSMRDVDPA